MMLSPLDDKPLSKLNPRELADYLEDQRKSRRRADGAAREPWVPYLSDRVDGVRGHYAVCRWNPGKSGLGYREAWNLRRKAWASASEEVLTLAKAEKLLQRLTAESSADNALKGRR